MTKEEKLKTVEKIVEPEYRKIKCWVHGFSHIEKVVEVIGMLAKMEGNDPYPYKLAAYCHDLGRVREEESGLVTRSPELKNMHAEYSVAPAKKVLTSVGITGQELGLILEAICKHSCKMYVGENNIAKLLQDADKSDGIGKRGIVRVATFNCELDIDEPNEKEWDNAIVETRAKLIKNKNARDRFIDISRIEQEWEDNAMLHSDSAKKYFKEDFKVLRDFAKSLQIDMRP